MKLNNANPNKTPTPILEAGVEIWCNSGNNANNLWSTSSISNNEKDGGMSESNIDNTEIEQNDMERIMCNNNNKENWSNQQKSSNTWYNNTGNSQQQYINNNQNKWNNNDQLSNFTNNKRMHQQSWSTSSNPDSPTKSQWFDQQQQQQQPKNDKFKQWPNNSAIINNNSSNTWIDPNNSDMGVTSLQQPAAPSSPSSSSTTSINTTTTNAVQNFTNKIEPMGWDEPDITQSKKLDDGTNIWGDPQMYKQKKVQNWTSHTKHVPNQSVIKPAFEQEPQSQQQPFHQSVLQPINTNTATNSQWNRSQSQWNNTPAAPISANEPTQSVSVN